MQRGRGGAVVDRSGGEVGIQQLEGIAAGGVPVKVIVWSPLTTTVPCEEGAVTKEVDNTLPIGLTSLAVRLIGPVATIKPGFGSNIPLGDV